MGQYIIYSILGVIVILQFVLIYYSNKREQKCKSIIQDQNKYIGRISDTILRSKEYLQKLDEKGILQSDDEVGYFFDQMKKVQLEINNYIIDTVQKNEETEKE